MYPRLPSWSLAALLLAPVLGCTGPDDDSDPDTDADTDTEEIPDRYEFESRFTEGSSVAYKGQVFRHLLIHDMKGHLGALTARLDGGSFFPARGDVASELDFYFSFDSATSGSVPHLFQTSPLPAQAVYDDVSTGANLVSKIAGNDAVGQHEDWATAFTGWPEGGVTTPESLVRVWFDEIDAAAVARADGDIPLTPDGDPVPAVYVSPDGRDRQQLLQKFLLGAVAFSQGSDDYLDDDTAGSGLLSSNVAGEGEAYSPLEHGWDEGFGYFGAPRDLPAWTDEAVADPTYADTFAPDGAIDLLSEVSWGHSQNAARRDLGAAAAAPTDFTREAWEAFVGGRRLIAGAEGELSEAQLGELRGLRDRAVGAWEAAIAASVVHYINDVLREMEAGPSAGRFADHAKAWSEMKGFSLSLQFNPRSRISDEDFARLQALLGTRPVLAGAPPAEIASYASDLRDAREIIGDAFGFDAANLGDEHGENGW